MLIQGIGKLLADIDKGDKCSCDIDDGSVSQLTFDDLSYQIEDDYESKGEDIVEGFYDDLLCVDNHKNRHQQEDHVKGSMSSFRKTATMNLPDSHDPRGNGNKQIMDLSGLFESEEKRRKSTAMDFVTSSDDDLHSTISGLFLGKQNDKSDEEERSVTPKVSLKITNLSSSRKKSLRESGDSGNVTPRRGRNRYLSTTKSLDGLLQPYDDDLSEYDDDVENDFLLRRHNSCDRLTQDRGNKTALPTNKRSCDTIGSMKNFQWQYNSQNQRHSDLGKQHQKLNQSGRLRQLLTSRSSTAAPRFKTTLSEMKNSHWPQSDNDERDAELSKQQQQQQKLNQTVGNEVLAMPMSRRSQSLQGPALANYNEPDELGLSLSSTRARRIKSTSGRIPSEDERDSDDRSVGFSSRIASRLRDSGRNNAYSEGKALDEMSVGSSPRRVSRFTSRTRSDDKVMSDETSISSSPRRVPRFRSKVSHEALHQQQRQQRQQRSSSNNASTLDAENNPASDNFKVEINKIASSLSNYYTPRAKKRSLGAGNFSSDDDNKCDVEDFEMSQSERTSWGRRRRGFELTNTCPKSSITMSSGDELSVLSERSIQKTRLTSKFSGPKSRIRTRYSGKQQENSNKKFVTSTAGIRRVVASASFSDLAQFIEDNKSALSSDHPEAAPSKIISADDGIRRVVSSASLSSIFQFIEFDDFGDCASFGSSEMMF